MPRHPYPNQPHSSPGFSSKSSTILVLALVVLIQLLGGQSQAGATGSEWIVVVNGDSTNSRTLANHFCALRNIPFRNVIVLRSVPDRDRISVDEFRDRILGPLLKEIEARGLAPTIQGIAYSCDFPTAVAIDSDLKELKDRSTYLTPVGSINGLTYLFRWVLAKNPMYIGFEANWFAAREGSALLNVYTGTPEQRQELQEFLENNLHEQAAQRIDDLRDTVENSFPIDFLAARQWSLAGNKSKAKERLASAIRKGWRYRKEITGDPAFDSLTDDPEFQKIVNRCPNDDFRYLPTRGFDARRFYAPNTLESLKPDQGISYLLSTMLSVTRDQGITMPEAIAHLERSALADYSRPVGGYFFMSTSDVRTTAREPNFAIAVEKLKDMKLDARVVKSPLPGVFQKVNGVTFGLAQFNWPRSGAQLLPGSIAENLTSLGGVMTDTSQTKSTELLRFGAAISSGTVTEPYAIQNKFPHPMIHVHYAQGLTSAEAYYQSVLCPYQLLIVGDPLCQPFAESPRFMMQGIKRGDRVKGVVTLQLVASEADHTVDPVRLTWFVDGVPKNESPFQNRVRVQVADADQGAQEWRLVAKGPKPFEHRFEQSVWVMTGPAESDISIQGPERWTAKDGEKLKITFANPPKAGTIAIRHDWEILAKQPIDQTTFELDAKDFGAGPVRLQGIVLGENDQVLRASMPITVQVEG
ncbi:MAG: hypothetical protein MUF23_03645 [Pirellula sp.]|nr:hypothetical protein [Pirellula sp.]